MSTREWVGYLACENVVRLAFWNVCASLFASWPAVGRYSQKSLGLGFETALFGRICNCRSSALRALAAFMPDMLSCYGILKNGRRCVRCGLQSGG
jgi:hypothetical protein